MSFGAFLSDFHPNYGQKSVKNKGLKSIPGGMVGLNFISSVFTG